MLTECSDFVICQLQCLSWFSSYDDIKHNTNTKISDHNTYQSLHMEAIDALLAHTEIVMNDV